LSDVVSKVRIVTISIIFIMQIHEYYCFLTCDDTQSVIYLQRNVSILCLFPLTHSFVEY
jgi:hypothetical protein